MFARRSLRIKQGLSNSGWFSYASSTGGCLSLHQGHFQSLTVVSVKDNATAIETACKLDLGKGVFESNLAELDFCTTTLLHAINNLRKWTKDEKAPDVPLDMMILRPKIRKDPLGTVLIIGSVAFDTAVSRLSERNATDSLTGPTTSQSILSSLLWQVQSQQATLPSSSPARTPPMSPWSFRG